MEKVSNLIVADADFNWDDVGSWTSMRNQILPDDNNNVVQGLHAGVDTSNCIIVGNSNHLIATVDVKEPGHCGNGGRHSRLQRPFRPAGQDAGPSACLRTGTRKIRLIMNAHIRILNIGNTNVQIVDLEFGFGVSSLAFREDGRLSVRIRFLI